MTAESVGTKQRRMQALSGIDARIKKFSDQYLNSDNNAEKKRLIEVIKSNAIRYFEIKYIV